MALAAPVRFAGKKEMQLRSILVPMLAVVLAGCAAQPQRTVVQMDTTSDKYATEECRAIRQTALAYDDNVAGRAGVGLGLGLLLGPFGIPLAMAVDASQNAKREAINTELLRHCGGSLAIYKAPPAIEPPGGASCPGGVRGTC